MPKVSSGNELLDWMLDHLVEVENPHTIWRSDTGDIMSMEEFHRWGAEVQEIWEQTGVLPS